MPESPGPVPEPVPDLKSKLQIEQIRQQRTIRGGPAAVSVPYWQQRLGKDGGGGGDGDGAAIAGC